MIGLDLGPAWVGILVLTFNYCLTLGSLLTLAGPSFHICKMGMINNDYPLSQHLPRRVVMKIKYDVGGESDM